MQGYQESDALEAARHAVYRASYEVKLILAEIAHKRFDPNQPRVPAGNSDGGQWTSTGGSSEGRIQVVSRTPPRSPGGRQNTNGPPVRAITIAGRTEWVSPKTFHQYNSSYALAQSMTSLARRFDPNWRPESTMVGNVAGQIAANNATAAQALRHIQRINPNAISSSGSTLSIIAPRGQPPGFVARDAAASIRTLRTQREFETMAANLTAGARPFQLTNYNGIAFQRHDGVIVGFRTSQTHGPTIDLMFPRGIETPVTKFHLLRGAKSAFNGELEIDMHIKKNFPIVRNVELVEFDVKQRMGNQNFLDFCEGSMGSCGFEEPSDFNQVQNVLHYYFSNDLENLEKATRYFLGYILSRGYAPMNFVNIVDPELEYGPITKYGLRPQEIIDNIIADWRSRNYESFDFFEVMFGWEQDCGLFMEDDPEGPDR